MADLVLSGVPKTLLGYSCISRLPYNIKEIGKRFILVLDEKLNSTSIVDVVKGALKEREIDFFVSEIPEGGEKSEFIEKALFIARSAHVQGVIAVGGEKAMHAALVVAALFNEKKSIYDVLDGKEVCERSLPLVCVPTTIRSSFIFSSIFPVVDSRNGKLRFIKAKDRPCKITLWDAAFSETLEEKEKAAFLLEVLSMLIETYISQKANFFSDMLSEKAFSLLAYLFNEEKIFSENVEEITAVKVGFLASLAASSCAEGEASLLSLLMNTQFGVKKTHSVCVLLPHIIQEAQTFRNDRLEKISAFIKAGEGGVFQTVQNVIDDFSLPKKLREVELSADDLSVISEDAAESPLINTLPKSTSADDIYNLLKKAY